MKNPGGVRCYHLTPLHALGRQCLFERTIKVETQL